VYIKSTYRVGLCIVRVCIYIHGMGVYIYIGVIFEGMYTWVLSYMRCVYEKYI